jgi:hypothetical protein
VPLSDAARARPSSGSSGGTAGRQRRRTLKFWHAAVCVAHHRPLRSTYRRASYPGASYDFITEHASHPGAVTYPSPTQHLPIAHYSPPHPTPLLLFVSQASLPSNMLPELPDEIWERVAQCARAADLPALAASCRRGRRAAAAATARRAAALGGGEADNKATLALRLRLRDAPRPGYYMHAGLCPGDGRWLVAVHVRCCAACNVGMRFEVGAGVGAVAELWDVGGGRLVDALEFEVLYPGEQRLEFRWVRRDTVCLVLGEATVVNDAPQVHTLRIDEYRGGCGNGRVAVLRRVESAYVSVDIPVVDVFEYEGAGHAGGALPQLVRVTRDRYEPLPPEDAEAGSSGEEQEAGLTIDGLRRRGYGGVPRGARAGALRGVNNRIAALRDADGSERGSDDEGGPDSRGALSLLVAAEDGGSGDEVAPPSPALSVISAASDSDDDDDAPLTLADLPVAEALLLRAPPIERPRPPRRCRRRRRVAGGLLGGEMVSYTRTVVVGERVCLEQPLRVQTSMDARVLLVGDVGSQFVKTYAVSDGAHDGPCECGAEEGGRRCRCGSDALQGLRPQKTAPLATIPMSEGISVCFLSPCGAYVAVVTSTFRTTNPASGCTERLTIALHESDSDKPLSAPITFDMLLTGDVRPPHLLALGVISAPVRGGYHDSFFTDISDSGGREAGWRCDAFVVPILDEELPVVIRVQTGEVLCAPPLGALSIEAVAERRAMPATVFSLNESLLLTVFSAEAGVGTIKVFDCVAKRKLIATLSTPGVHRWRCEAHPAGYVYVENSCFCCSTSVLLPVPALTTTRVGVGESSFGN